MKNKTDNCPFCSSSIGEITIAESENFRCIYNIAPILPGHSLIIPKSHVESIFELNEAESEELIHFAKDVIRKLLQVFRCEGFNLTIQEKKEAGQTIAHFHMHVIPRKDGDLNAPGDWYPKLVESQIRHLDSENRPKLSRDQLKEVVSKIRSQIS